MRKGGSVGGDASLRLFLALRLPDAVLDTLQQWQRGALVGGGRPLARDHLHVTLAFLGRRPAGELDGILAALRASVREARPFELEPLRYRETRGVGMLVLADPSGEAGWLAAGLHARLAALGAYVPERRRWLPHVTVLRFRSPPGLTPPLPALGAFAPSEAAAFLSRLHPAGAQYEVLDAVSLGG